MGKITIRVLGSGMEVGRAAISITSRGKSVLLDYGVNFTEDDRPQLPEHIRPSDVLFVAVTHAHLDHVGAVPYLYTTKYQPVLVMNRLTKAVSEVLIKDFTKISGYYLPFDESDWYRAVENIRYVEMNVALDIEGLGLRAINSGHIPGSQSYLVDADDARILYTGDVNTVDTKLVRGYDTSTNRADVLIIEGTYADVDHPGREDVEKALIDSIKEVVAHGGNVLIPCFSFGRAQEILSLLYERFSEGKVYYDGMVRIMNSILVSYPEYINNYELLLNATQEFEEVKSASQRRKIVKSDGSVIVASAGMLKGGPSLYYLRKIYDDPKSAVFLVSYQAPSTPGRRILEDGVLEGLGPIRARVEWYDFSSHTGYSGLLKIVKSVVGLRAVVIVHTTPQAHVLAEELKQHYEVYIPRTGDSLEIET